MTSKTVSLSARIDWSFRVLTALVLICSVAAAPDLQEYTRGTMRQLSFVSRLSSEVRPHASYMGRPT